MIISLPPTPNHSKCALSRNLNFLKMISDNLVKEKDLNAGNIIRDLAKEIQGGGGGQPFFATAGGKKIEGLDAVVSKAKELV